MVSLLYLKQAYEGSDRRLVIRWTENLQWQYYDSMEYYQAKFPCKPNQFARFSQLPREAEVDELPKGTIDIAVRCFFIYPYDR